MLILHRRFWNQTFCQFSYFVNGDVGVVAVDGPEGEATLLKF